MKVDVSKNFTFVTSMGRFSVHYLIERYIFENVYPALTHYFWLKLPIKQSQQQFFQ